MTDRKRHLITMIIVVLIIAGTALSIYVASVRAEKASRARAQNVLTDNAREQAATLSAAFFGKLKVLESLSAQLSNQYGQSTPSELIARLSAVKRDASLTFDEIVYIDGDGSMTGENGSVRANVSNDQYFKDAMNGSCAIDANNRIIDGRKALIISVPYSADGEVRGVICGIYYENELEGLLQNESFGGAGFSLLLDSAGNVLAKANRLNILNGNDNILDFFRSQTVKLENADTADRLEKALNEEQVAAVYYKAGSSSRIAVVAPFMGDKLPDNDWSVMNVVDVMELEREIAVSRRDTYETLLIFVVFSFTGLILFLLLERDHRRRIMKDNKEIYERDEDLRYAAEHDILTGLPNRETFYNEAQRMISAHEPGYYIMTCFDVNGFKMINDQYGTEKGDKLLKHLAKVFSEGFAEAGGICCRIAADNFSVLYPAKFAMTDRIEQIRTQAGSFDGTMAPVTFCIGRYIVSDKSLSPDAMYERAVIAKDSIKGRYDVHIGVYDESMRQRILREQRVVDQMGEALSAGQFEVWLQPQYNHSTGMMIGAEALVRWRHPELGMIMPATFIPIFERNGFIFELDSFVWESVCKLLRRWLDEDRSPLPISVNVSRRDVFNSEFFPRITGLVQKYGLSTGLLRLEITESAFSESTGQIIATVRKLREFGFFVEIDDFGSGYSSLNTLKNVQADVLKLDMRFLEDDDGTHRGGNILESVVRMAKWLEMPVIAEGVETLEQADFLKSIGCNYIQGYLYARPMTVADYEELASRSGMEDMADAIRTVEGMNAITFWSPKSLDSLIFSSYVGAACVLEFSENGCEMIRVNESFCKMLKTTLSVQKLLETDPMQYLDAEGTANMRRQIENTTDINDEVTGEVKATVRRDDVVYEEYLRYSGRIIAQTELRKIVYMLTENITRQREAEIREHRAGTLLENIVESASNGICAFDIQDGESRLIFANDRYYEMQGYTRAQFEAEVTDTFQTVHPDDLRTLKRKIAAAYEKNERFSTEYRMVCRGDDTIWVHTAVTLMPYAGMEKPVLLTEITNITQRKLSDQRMMDSTEQLRFLNETSRSFLTEANPQRAMNDVLSKVREYFSGSRVYVFERGPKKNCFSNTFEVCARGISAEIDNLQNVSEEHMYFWLETFKSQSHLYIPDIEKLEPERQTEKDILMAQGISSIIAVPLERNGSLLGFIGVDDPKRRLTGVEYLEALGTYIVVMLTRRDALIKMKRDHDTILELMNDTPGGFMRMEMKSSGSIVPVFINEGFCRMVGMTSADVNEKYAADAFYGVHPDDKEIVRQLVFEMLQNGETYSARYRIEHGGGWYVAVRTFGKLSQTEEGERFFNVYFTSEGSEV